jgi:molybdopterin synthase sulfur carrier subunit
MTAMPVVYIPTLMRDLTGGAEKVEVEGATLRQVVNDLDARYPGARARLCQDDRIRPDIAVAVDGEITRQGMLQTVTPSSEVHFVPAVSGGN